VPKQLPVSFGENLSKTIRIRPKIRELAAGNVRRGLALAGFDLSKMGKYRHLRLLRAAPESRAETGLRSVLAIADPERLFRLCEIASLNFPDEAD
jgi:hypothetical protein